MKKLLLAQKKKRDKSSLLDRYCKKIEFNFFDFKFYTQQISCKQFCSLYCNKLFLKNSKESSL